MFGNSQLIGTTNTPFRWKINLFLDGIKPKALLGPYIVTGGSPWLLFSGWVSSSRAVNFFLWVICSTLRPEYSEHFIPRGRATYCCLSSLCGDVGWRAVITQLFTLPWFRLFSDHWDSIPMTSLSISSSHSSGLRSCAGEHITVPMENEGCLGKSCVWLIDGVCSIHGLSAFIWGQTCCRHSTLLVPCILTFMFTFETVQQTPSFLCGSIPQT